MTGQKRKYKTNKVKSFLFFLLLAAVFWVLTKYSENTSAVVTTDLAFTNLPNSVSVSSRTPKEVGFYTSANGFQFLSYSWKRPSTTIDMSKYYEEGDTLVLISGSELGKIINTQLGNDTRVNNLSIEELPVFLNEMASKKVAVRLSSEVTFKEGYKLLGSIKVSPDSVTVSGPSAEVEQIQYLVTETLVKKGISETMEGTLKIVTSDKGKLLLSHNEVEVRLDVAEFTQKRLVLPIMLTNAPGDMKLKLLPENVTISFDIPVSRFNQISENDFRVICDYNTRSSEENIMVPQLDMQPEGLQHMEWSTKKVEYLIFK